MEKIDESIVEEVCKMLNLATEFSQETQNEIFSDIQSFKSLQQINFYILAAISNDSLSEESKCAAIILMRHFFVACTDLSLKESFKNISFSVLSEFFGQPPSPLTNCVSSLLAEFVKYFGFDVFPEIPEMILQLLGNPESQQSGLSLLYECLLLEIDMNPEIIEILQKQLETEQSVFILKICCLFAYKYPEEVRGLILETIFQAEFNQINDNQLLEIVEICRVCLERLECDESIIEFLIHCINSENDDISTNSVAIFEENESIPFCEAAISSLYQRLSFNEDLYIYNNSLQALYSISSIAHRFPSESLPILFSFFDACSEESDNADIVKMLRCITAITDLLEDPEMVALKAKELFEKEPKETVYCWSFLCQQCPSVSSPALDVVSPLLTAPDKKLRIQVMKSLPTIMHYTAVQSEPLTSIFIQCLNSYSLWECVLLCNTLEAFFKEVSDLEGSESGIALVTKLCEKFNECDELNPFLFASLIVFPAILKSSPAFFPIIMENLGEKFVAALKFDDTELATGSMDFFISVIECGQSEAISCIVESIIADLPSSNWLGSEEDVRKVRGWRLMHSLALNNETMFQSVAEWIQPGACAEIEGEFMPYSIDEICNTLFDLIGVMEFTEEAILNIFNLLKHVASFNFITQNVAACFLRLMGTFPEIIIVEEQLLKTLVPMFSSFIGTERQDICEELLEAYFSIHPFDPND